MEFSGRVLIVDDMPAIRMLMRGMLSTFGFETIDESDDGGLAWKLIQAAAFEQIPYQLILADWNMNAMSGVELLRAVRSFPKTGGIPFLIVSAESDREHLDAAKSAGASGYIVKPFSQDELKAKIGQALSRVF